MESTVTKPAATPSALSDRFWFGATAIFILAVALRQWGLGAGPFHPDEAIHAYFSGGFRNYHYDPVYHGPLLYHLVATVFGIVGGARGMMAGTGPETSGEFDYTARLVPSLLGILLIWMVLGPARKFLGNRGALASAALLAVSPSMVTYSRHLLHDSLVLVLTMGAVLCLLVSLENGANTERGRGARIGLAAFLTLFLATKANFFFIAVMLASFYVTWLAAGTLRTPQLVTRWVPLVLLAIVSGTAILFPRDNTFSEVEQKTQHEIFQVVALLACGVMGFWLLTGRQREGLAAVETKAEEDEKEKEEKEVDKWTTYVLALIAILWLYVFLFGNGAQILIEWAQSRSFPTQTYKDGCVSAISAIHRMLEYWGGQQGKPRLPGRHDYYFVLMLLYEVPIFLAALGGIWHASKNRSTFTDLLLWWAFTSWTVYAVANEKVPWLLVHTVLPLALLAGLWLGQIQWRKPAFMAVALAGLLFSLRGVSGTSFERAGDNAEPILYAQTPDAFRDALRKALRETSGDSRTVWLKNDRQWPSVWYLGRNEPYIGSSVASIEGEAGLPKLEEHRIAVGDESLWTTIEQGGWTGERANFLIWPRASWYALAPQRYWRWFFTRDTLPKDERDLPQSDWKKSILGGKGEWSHAVAVVARPMK